LVNLAENDIKKSLNKFDPGMSMVSLSRCLCQQNVFVLIFDLVQHVATNIDSWWVPLDKQHYSAISGLLLLLC